MGTSDLVEGAKKGSIDMFIALLREKQDMLYRIAYTYTGNQPDAEDCLSDAAIHAYERLRQLRNADHFYSWFTSILINTCRQYCRRKLKTVELHEDWEMAQEELDAFATARSVEDRIMVEQLLAQLHQNERDILILRYLNEFSLQEIASILDMPLGTVKSSLHRSLQKLRERVVHSRSEVITHAGD